MSEAVSSESKSTPLPLTRSSVLAAHRAIEGQIHRTPVLTSSSLSGSLPGANTLYFKAENLQRGGAFKFRGASYSLACLTPDELAKGVCTHSSGNHAGALALAAKQRGVPCYVVMTRARPCASFFPGILHIPSFSPGARRSLTSHPYVYAAPHPVLLPSALNLLPFVRTVSAVSARMDAQPSNSAQPKIDAVRSYGASVTFCAPTAPARAAALAAVREETGAAFVPPYDAANTILGQGTAMLELLAQVPEPLAAVIAPVGGGGLLAGTALAAEGTGVRVFGAEPAGADDCARGLEEGRRREEVDARTVADGLRTPVGVLNFGIIKEKVEKVITVTDEEIIEAMRLLWERMKIVVEPSGAASFAAVRSGQFQALGIEGPVGIIISGGNIDLSKPLPWVQANSS